MIEPIFTDRNRIIWESLETPGNTLTDKRDKALLLRATSFAIQGAFDWGQDLPVGAVAALEDEIIGHYIASDRRNGYRQMHAEYMAEMDASMQRLRGVISGSTDTMVVTLEPCNNCQDFLATLPGLRRVGFGVLRSTAAEMGILKPHDETISERSLRLSLPYEVVQIEDPDLLAINIALLENTQRNPVTEEVRVDKLGLQRSLALLSQE